MNYGVWQGNSLLSFPRVLILGESHYDEENYGEAYLFLHPM